MLKSVVKGCKGIDRVFRVIAGVHLVECAKLGIPELESIEPLMKGTDKELTESLLLDSIALVKSGEGCPVNLVNNNSILFAKAKKCSPIRVVTLEEQRTAFYGDVVSSSTEKIENTLEEDVEETGFEEVEEVEETEEAEEEGVKEEEVESEESMKDSEFENKIYQYYGSYCDGAVNVLRKRYTDLFASGYEVLKPFGLLSQDGVVRLSGNERVIGYDAVEISKVYTILRGYLGFTESPVRSIMQIGNTLYAAYTTGGKPLLYFPNKLLEIAYGRESVKTNNTESLSTYPKHSSSASWKGYVKNELDVSLRYLVRKSAFVYVKTFMEGNGIDSYKDVKIQSSIEQYLKYVVSCLSMCLLIPEYKFTSKDGMVESRNSFKIRLCDPLDVMGTRNVMPELISGAFMSDNGVDPMTFQPRIMEETFVKEYSHEFNHTLTNVMPLFAYKALESLKLQGLGLSWDSAIMGMFEDGSILRNGTHGVALKAKLCHWIVAGSRAGKGVKTLNLLASGVASNKTIFYGDRKPDMASLLKYIAPEMCVINGGGYSGQYDTKYKQFTELDSLLNSQHVPSMVTNAFQTTMTWDELGDVVYMRFIKLVIGIIIARGDGRYSDPLLGGNDGILFVVDEFKNFQEGFANLVSKLCGIVPPTTIDKDRESLSKGSISQNTFDKSYNDAGFYALSYLNSLAEDLRFLSEKNDAGFNQKEIELSDIIVLGQSLEKGMADKSMLLEALRNSPGSARYRSAGSYGLKSFNMGSQSIPYNLVSFKPCDAFFGRNTEEGRSVYLAQTNSNSKAFGRLDDKASNFGYMSSFTEEKRQKIVAGRSSENIQLADSLTYFKPFLILNTSGMNDDCVTGCFNRVYNNGGITADELISENPNADGTALNPAVGFEDYLRLAGCNNYKEVLEKSRDVANYVVQQCLGYQGDWLEFLTDLRPEWIFTIKDVADGAKGIVPMLRKPMENPILEEFVAFNSEYFGCDDTSGYGEDIENVMGMACSLEDDFSDFDKMLDNQDGNLNSILTEETVKDEEPTNSSLFYNVDEIGDDDEIDIFNEIEESIPLEDTGYAYIEDEFRLSEPDDQMREILEHIEALRGMGINLEVGSDGWSVSTSEVETSGSPITSDAVPVSTFGSDIGEIRYSEDTEPLERLIKLITEDLIKTFGGLGRFRSFGVSGGSVVVNGYVYRCKIDSRYAKCVPYDMRREINSGNISKIIDYNIINAMNMVSSLEFDSMSLLYDYVLECLGYSLDGCIDELFNQLPRLMTIKIGGQVYERSTYAKEIKENDVFYKAKKSKIIEGYCRSGLERSKGNVKKAYNSKDYGKAVKAVVITASAIGVVATGAGIVGSKVGSKAVKGLGSFSRGIKDLFIS